jgi:pyridoxine 5-phosphate synthase
VSLFIDPDSEVLEAVRSIGVSVVELHTGRYADATLEQMDIELERIQKAAYYGHELGLRVNAGHGLNEANVIPIAKIPTIAELNIGHAIVAQAIFKGWKTAIADMKSLMLTARAQGQTWS